MPRISELVRQPNRTFTQSEPLSSLRPAHPPAEQPPLGFNVLLRCPIPAIGTANPDSLRQFYRSGLNQMRVFAK